MICGDVRHPQGAIDSHLGSIRPSGFLCSTKLAAKTLWQCAVCTADAMANHRVGPFDQGALRRVWDACPT